MASSTTRLALGAAIALGMAIAGLSATGTPLNVAQTLVNLRLGDGRPVTSAAQETLYSGKARFARAITIALI